MRYLLLLFSSLVVVSTASAQDTEDKSFLERLIRDDKMLNIMLDTRFDGQLVTGDNIDKELGFRAHTLKLWVSGEIVPGITYRLRHRLNKPQDPLERDNLSGATDQAWVAFDIGRNKKWNIMVGKQSVQFGTFEYDYNPADIYLPTMAFDDLDAYKTGVNVAYRFLGQTLNLQVVNSDAPQFASHEYRKKALAINTLWVGDLWNGVVKTRWAYGAFQHTKKKFYSWLTAGTQFNIRKFTAEFDYYFGARNMDIASIVGAPDPLNLYVRDQSGGINLKYDFGIFRPFVKGTLNERYDKDMKRTAYVNYGIQTGLELYPFKHKLLKDLRFHLIYWFNETKFKGSYKDLSNKNNHTVLLGMRWLFKAK